MENEKNLFQIELEDIAKLHLKETARWARFLAITGLVGVGLLFIIGFGSVVYNASNSSGMGNGDQISESVAAVLTCVIIGGLYFFPCLFLLRFSGKMNRALLSGDAHLLSESLRNLKITFRYMGVVAIILLAFFAIGMIGIIADN